MQVEISAQGKYSLSSSHVVGFWFNVIFYSFKVDLTDFVSEKCQTKSQSVSNEQNQPINTLE